MIKKRKIVGVTAVWGQCDKQTRGQVQIEIFLFNLKNELLKMNYNIRKGDMQFGKKYQREKNVQKRREGAATASVVAQIEIT